MTAAHMLCNMPAWHLVLTVGMTVYSTPWAKAGERRAPAFGYNSIRARLMCRFMCPHGRTAGKMGYYWAR